MSQSRLLLSVKIGDGLPGPTTRSLQIDLACMVHEEAITHYSWPAAECHHHGYSTDTIGRSDFERDLRDLGVPDEEMASYLDEWDAASRPIAIIHYWKVPVQ